MSISVGDLVTSDYRFEYNGLVIGANTPYDITEISGLFGYPQVRRSLDDRLGAHGGVPGRHYVQTRDFSIHCGILASSDVEFEQLRRDMFRAYAPRSSPRDQLRFVFRMPGAQNTFIMARPTAIDLTADRRYALNYPEVAVRFEATDPRHYSLAAATSTATPPQVEGGLTFPLTFPLTFGAGSTGDIVVLNTGTAPAHWTGVVRGPCTNPVVTDVTRGFELRMQPFTLLAGQQLRFDTRERSVLLGTQTQRNFLTATSKFFTLPPGQPITIRYTATTLGEGSRFIMTHRNASWGEG
jgi:hypothetical protein